MTSVYFACRFQQIMQLHSIAAFQLCPIHAALSAPCGQTVSPATHHALQLELGGGEGDAGVSASLSISPFLIISWCLIAALTVSPMWAFPAPSCYFKSTRHGESMSHPPLRPGRLPMDVIKGGFRKRLLAAAGPRPCCLTADGRQDSSSTTLHQRQI